jgi:DNA-binding SARP family transcriptional activator
VLEFRILGPLEVVTDTGPVRLGGPRQRATLAILVLNANRVVSVDRLADDLYAGAAPVTAVTQVQRQISELRKVLGSASAIETRPPGYVLHASHDQLDLTRFERFAGEATVALEREDAKAAADLLRSALELWRGPPLADLAYEPFAATSIDRLEEIRLAALETRIDADLRLGRNAELIGELEELVAAEPFRERFRAQLMLALYRSGRQADALNVYRRTRALLVEEFGIEPTAALHELERAILTKDPSLDLDQAAARSTPTGAILVLPSALTRLDELLTLAEPLASQASRELIVARLLADVGELPGEASALNARRATISVPSRVAAFTSRDASGDLVRLATAHDVGLVLMDAPHGIDAKGIPGALTAILERSPAAVAFVAGSPIDLAGAGVFVPFGGGEHDWAALELGAWLACALSTPLRLVGTEADPARGRSDASRLLADASLAVQRVVGVETTPLLADATGEALVAAVQPASVVVAGISPRWRREGIGAARRAIFRDSRRAVVLVHRGPRPGGLAPHESRTRFSWSIEAS